METKASYIMVGAFTLLAFFLIVGFAVWSATRGSGDMVKYSIEFSGSVSGLSIGSEVTLNGIKIGQVTDVWIDESDPSKVQVIIAVRSNSPIREDSDASLSTQALTGVSSIAISGGTAGAHRLKPAHGEEMARIQSRKSRLETVIAEAPDLMDAMRRLVKNANSFMSDENKDNFRSTLASLAIMAKDLEEGSAPVVALLKELEEAGRRANVTLAEVNKLLSGDIAGILGSVRELTVKVDKLLGAVEPALSRFSVAAVNDVQSLLVEARELVRSLDELSRRLNQDPKRLIYGDSIPEYKIQ